MDVMIENLAERAWSGVDIEMINVSNKEHEYSEADRSLLHDAFVKGFELGFESGNHYTVRQPFGSYKIISEEYYVLQCQRCGYQLHDQAGNVIKSQIPKTLEDAAHKEGWFFDKEGFALCPPCQRQLAMAYLNSTKPRIKGPLK